jgi:hypothetical protein
MQRGSSETTPEQEARIRALWAENARRDDIAAAVGMTRDSFLVAQRRLELPPRPRSVGSGNRGVDPTEAEIRQACAEIRSRWTDADHLQRAGLIDPETGEAHERGCRIIPIREIAAGWEERGGAWQR